MGTVILRFVWFMGHGLRPKLLWATDASPAGNSRTGSGGFTTEGVSKREAFPIYKLLLITIRKSHI